MLIYDDLQHYYDERCSHVSYRSKMEHVDLHLEYAVCFSLY